MIRVRVSFDFEASRMEKRQFGSIRKLPSGRFQARYRDGLGGRHAATFTSKADAGAWLSTQQTDQVRGQWIDPTAGRVTLEEYASSWLQLRCDLRPRTIELYEGLLRLHVLPSLGAMELGQITTPGLRAWHARMLRSGSLSKSTVAKAYRLRRTILQNAVDDGVMLRNPCSIKGAAVERAIERTPATLEEVAALAAGVSERYRTLILMAAFTGLKWGELIALARRRVDVEQRIVKVVEQFVELKDGTRVLGPPKTAAGIRTVAIPPHILGDIAIHLATVSGPGPDDLVFPSPDGGRLRRSNFNRREFQPAVAVANLPNGFRFHDLRHTGNTLAASTGASTRELMARLGHASPRAALIYQHATPERDQRIADAISEIVQGAARARTDS